MKKIIVLSAALVFTAIAGWASNTISESIALGLGQAQLGTILSFNAPGPDGARINLHLNLGSTQQFWHNTLTCRSDSTASASIIDTDGELITVEAAPGTVKCSQSYGNAQGTFSGYDSRNRAFTAKFSVASYARCWRGCNFYSDQATVSETY